VIEIKIPFGKEQILAYLPDGSDILRMSEICPLSDQASALQEGLARPIGTPSLSKISRAKYNSAQALGHSPKACIVVSDNTRPVPYREPNGILMPIIETILREGFAISDICILVATGTHRAMSREELETMLGHEPFEVGIEVVNHDCLDKDRLICLGSTSRGTMANINKRYMEADLKILTGLVESHFMAGASGGRKSICPGLLGEEGTYIFHSASLMADSSSRDLKIEGNPVHEESLEVARMAGADFIVNVTIDSEFRITGVFCGDLEEAHRAAVAKLKSYVGISISSQYDLIVTHGGFVAINHYQAAKAAVASLGALKQGGGLILIADNKDLNPVGSDRYRILLALLKLIGPEAFDHLLMSPDWQFIPEQWQVQQWAKVFKKIAMEDFIYYAPQLDNRHWRDLPGIDGYNMMLSRKEFSEIPCEIDSALFRSACGVYFIPKIIEKSINDFLDRHGFTIEDIRSGRCRLAYLADGPYGIPLLEEGGQKMDTFSSNT
jgi:nickel-dependent lactate racemase